MPRRRRRLGGMRRNATPRIISLATRNLRASLTFSPSETRSPPPAKNVCGRSKIVQKNSALPWFSHALRGHRNSYQQDRSVQNHSRFSVPQVERLTRASSSHNSIAERLLEKRTHCMLGSPLTWFFCFRNQHARFSADDSQSRSHHIGQSSK